VNALEAALRRVASELDARGRRWALVGGLAALLRESSDADLIEARQAVRAIEARGYHRERELAESLETFLREESAEKPPLL
jgi:hypothetical protein